MTAGRIQDAVFVLPVFENSEQEQMAIPLKYCCVSPAAK